MPTVIKADRSVEVLKRSDPLTTREIKDIIGVEKISIIRLRSGMMMAHDPLATAQNTDASSAACKAINGTVLIFEKGLLPSN